MGSTRRTCRVVSSRVEASQVEFWLHHWSSVIHDHRLSATKLFRSPLLVSGKNYHVVSRLHFRAFPFSTFCSACDMTRVIIGHFYRFWYLLTYLLTSYIYLRSIISNDRNCDEDLSCRPATSNSTAQCWHYGNRAKSHCQPQRDFLLFLYCYIYLWIWKLNCQIQHIQIRIQAHKIIGYRKFRFKRYETGIRMTREQETNANGGTSFRRLLSPVWHMTWHDMTRQNKSWQKIRLICVHKNIDRQLMLTHKFFT